MKKKSGNSRQRTRPIAPLVRGPLKTKEKGELAELAFLHKAASLGFGVARPHGDSERYDFILDSGERFLRVQVKSIFGMVEGMYRLRCTHGDNLTRQKKLIFWSPILLRKGFGTSSRSIVRQPHPFWRSIRLDARGEEAASKRFVKLGI